MTIHLVLEDRDRAEEARSLQQLSDAAETEGKPEESADFQAGQTQATAGSGAVGTAGGKRAKKEKKRRGPQQEFSHPWMVGALKGHTAPVLDMNFSSNGKFLASCAEDCGLRPEEEVLDPGEEEEEEDEEDADRYAAKQSPKEEEEGDEEGDEEEEEDEEVDAREKTAPREKSPTKKAPAPPATAGATATPAARSSKDDKAILSRRQRKNRTRAPRDCREDEGQQGQQQQAQAQQQQQQQPQQNQQQQQQQQQQQSNQQQSSQQSRRRRQQRQQSPKQVKKTPVTREVKTTAMEQHTSASRKSKVVSSQRRELRHLSDAALSSLLRRYTLSGEQLAHLGYPVECSYFPGYAVIISHHHPILHRTPRVHHHHRLDVNAREFVPGSSSLIESEADSGNGSGSSLESSDLESSDSDKSSDICESSSSSSSSLSSSSSSSSSSCSYQKRRVSTPDPEVILERRCARCFKMFYVNEGGEYLQEERCVYHWGKLKSGLIDEGGHHGDSWECCRGHGGSRGCTTAKMHVWTGLLPGYNGPFEGYVRTRPSRNPPKDGNYGVFALDCEMCFTRRGLELAKVTVVGVDGKIVYDALVRPDCDVIDHNTRFSGITAKDLAKATKRLKDVQRDITSFVYAETILIGHGLENDLRALRILHTTVIDTCVAFPHFLGYPYRSSLKTLARTVLRREIQVTEHDSVEDARIAIDLMLRRLQHDLS